MAEIAGTTKQLINQYKNKKLPQKYTDKILFYFSKYDKSNVCDYFKIKVHNDTEQNFAPGVEINHEKQFATFDISAKFLKDLNITPAYAEIFIAKGDSMEPVIFDGDSLLVDTTKKEIYDGILYCINLNGKICAKRLQNLSENTFGIVSDNKKYKMVETDKNNISIIGEIKWIGRIPK